MNDYTTQDPRKQRAHDHFTSQLDNLLLYVQHSQYLSGTDKLLLAMIIDHVKETGQYKNFPIPVHKYKSGFDGSSVRVWRSIQRLIKAGILKAPIDSEHISRYKGGDGNFYAGVAKLYSFADKDDMLGWDMQIKLQSKGNTRTSRHDVEELIERAMMNLDKPVKIADIVKYTGLKANTIRKWVSKHKTVSPAGKGREMVVND